MARIETGPAEFEGDWPGTFVRGDNSMWYAHLIGNIVTALNNGEKVDELSRLALLGLKDTLSDCANGYSTPTLLKAFDECGRNK
jgi:hypothetical protein